MSQSSSSSSSSVAREDKDQKGNRSRGLIHSVSIVVETVHDESDAPSSPPRVLGSEGKANAESAESLESSEPTEVSEAESTERGPLPRKERHQSSPLIFLDDAHFSGTLSSLHL